jgi:hypothetical protein
MTSQPTLLIRQIESLASVQAEDRNDNEAGVIPSNQRDLLVANSGATLPLRPDRQSRALATNCP